MRYNRTLDRGVGHDYPGVYSHGFVDWEIDELELGYRAACFLNDPEQAWWELIGYPSLRKMEQDEKAKHTGNTNDNGLGGISPEHL